MSIEYPPAHQLDLDSPSLVPATWPHPPSQAQPWPFSGGLVDYLRPVGPGVYVGVGWKGSEGSRKSQFLYFVMARREIGRGELGNLPEEGDQNAAVEG